MDAMVANGVSYCPMLVACQIPAGEGVAELEADPDFVGLFGEAERRDFHAFMHRLSGTWTPEDMRYWKKANENRLEWMRRFRQMGGVLLMGTDFQRGGITLHQELRNFAAIGMDPVEVVAAATGECAKAFRMERELGTISEGLRADVVVLNRSPAEDIGALRDIAHVLKDGSIVWSAGAGKPGHM